jgi:hypothetical protein
VLRIEKYAYNRQTKTGQGVLVQAISLLATDRPADVQVGGGVVASALQAPVAAVGSVIDRLVASAFDNAAINPPRLLGNQPGQYYGILSSRNPISDAQDLLGKYWRWMYCDLAETIRTVSGDPSAHAVTFTRSLAQLEWEPSIDHLDFAATRVIVTGSYQRPALVACQTDPAPLNPNLDRKARPKYQRVAEQQPINKVFSSGVSRNDTSPTTSEIKHIFYQYSDDRTWDSRLAAFLPARILNDLQTDQPLAEQPIDSPSQTATVYEWPAGRIFSSLGANTTLSVYAIEVQSERHKGRWVCRGTLVTSVRADFTLIIERYESLTTQPVIAGYSDHAGVVDPRTGNPACLTPQPRSEERQPLAPYTLETVAVKGTAQVQPLGWSPIANRDLVLEVGFLPSVPAANYLAQQIARREWRRRDSVRVTMPVPVEWLAAGCPPLPVATLDDGDWQCEGLIISMQDEKASFAFTANRISRNAVSTVQVIESIDLKFKVVIDVESVDVPIPVPSPPGTALIGFKVVVTVITSTSGGGGGTVAMAHSLSSGSLAEGTGYTAISHSLSSGSFGEGAGLTSISHSLSTSTILEG